MKVLVYFVFFIYFILAVYCDVDTFEFGVNEGRVSFATSGKIGLTEKNVRVPIVVPKCSRITYVRVDVDNIRGPPLVTFEGDVYTVVIKYRRLQFSRSTYVITAKSVPIPNCYGQEKVVTLINKFHNVE